MKDAAATYDNLMTLLGPMFDTFNNSVKDVKKELEDIQGQLRMIHDASIKTSDDIEVLKKTSNAHEKRITELETTARDNTNGVKEFRRARAVCIAGISSLATVIFALCTWAMTTYIENSQHEELVAIRQKEAATIEQLNADIAKLKKQLEERK